MFISSHNLVISQAIADALLAALSARPAAALLITPFVHLWTAGPATILPSAVPADFTEAAFVGYAASALALPLVGPINVDGETIGVTESNTFIGGAVVPPGEMIAGYWIDEAAAAGVNLYFAERFVSPVPIAVIGDFVSLDFIAALRTQLGF